MSDDFLDSTQEITITAERDALLRKVRAVGKAMLILLSGGTRGERALLGEEKFVLGRGATCDMQLDSDAVSRAHAYIEKRGEDHFLVDNQSTNGSYVNYKRVQEKQLQDGDQIQIGQSMIKFISGDNIETAYHEEFRRLVRHDALTGALNQATFKEEIRVAVTKADRLSLEFSLVAFDLDHFKQVNDTHGHTAGDLVLSSIGQRVREIVLEPHLFARSGGEEFVVLFWGGLADAAVLAERLRKAIEALSLDYEGHSLTPTASFGIALHREAESSAELQDAADKRLYEAKNSGRNCVEF
jgi:two-component system, cell cycle response regulator